MTTVDTARLRALSEAATHKRWKPTTQGGIEADDYTGPGEVFDSVASVHDSADWEYIEAADPQTMLALLDEIERLRGEGEWEHGYSLLNKDGEPTGLIIPANAREGAREGEAYVRRRAAGPWERVEGENDD